MSSPENAGGLKPQSTDEIHDRFIDFYKSKGYMHYPDSGIIPENDPTLLFINSGMAPLKHFFTGEQTPPENSLTNIQNCIRTGDIDDIGDSHHGTNFHMMGSWQFGPEFSKERATELAYELITDKENGFGIPEERLTASVLNDEAEAMGIPGDSESRTAWQRFFPNSRIIGLPPEDNLWGPAGTSGPLGPCTEVFFDRGSGYEQDPNEQGELLTGRHVEIWNAGVFMEFNKDENGDITPLQSKSVDGGAGLERFAMVLQNAPSIHEIDKWQPLYDEIYRDLDDTRMSRVISDHVRTSEILARSGVYPANKRGGYVLRRLMRKSFGILDGAGQPLSRLNEYRSLAAETIEVPGTVRNDEDVQAVFKSEEESFARILKQSRKLFEPVIKSGELDAKTVHLFRGTHGVPLDLIRETAAKHGIAFPEAEYAKLTAEA